jgi:hypothetical protein
MFSVLSCRAIAYNARFASWECSSMYRSSVRILLLLGALALGGCRGQVDRPPDPAEARLLQIGRAYTQACYRLNRAPKNFEEIKPNICGEIPPDLLRSPNDGQDFVIMWGVNYNELPPAGNDPFIIAAYEQTSTSGKRFVLRYPFSVVQLTDAEFQQAVFPPGFERPKP